MSAGAKTAGAGIFAVVALATALFAPAGAWAQLAPQPVAPYDGSNPFHCQLQDVGTGTAFPDPTADPFCVKFDKTNQNVTDLGIVDFLLQEPARTLAAVPKCFYYQRDEWTGSIVQGQQPELWHWVGGYWFDKARALGGVSVREFRVGGTPFSAYPYVPAAYRPYFDQAGGGGAQLQLASVGEPDCVAKVDTPEERANVFKAESKISTCIDPGGGIAGRRLGSVRLGATREGLHRKLGDPQATKGRAETWCVTGGDYLQVVFRGSPGAAALVRTTVRGQSADGIGAGSDAKLAQRQLGLTRLFRLGGTRVFEARHGASVRLLAGLGSRRVRWLSIVDSSAIRTGAALRRTLAAAL